VQTARQSAQPVATNLAKPPAKPDRRQIPLEESTPAPEDFSDFNVAA
jgi:hypothetical protein